MFGIALPLLDIFKAMPVRQRNFKTIFITRFKFDTVKLAQGFIPQLLSHFRLSCTKLFDRSFKNNDIHSVLN